MKRARSSSGRRIPTRQLLLQPEATGARAAGNGRARSLRCKRSGVAGSASTQARMKIERRASLETGNVTAEPIRKRRRPPSVREESSKSTAQKHRGIGAGMWAKEGSVNMGSPSRWGERPQLEFREEQSGSVRVAERSVVVRKRVTIVERRGLSSRATLKAARAGRLA
jgi:hypothetical protein